MLGFNRPEPEIKFFRITDTTARIDVVLGKKTYSRVAVMSTLFPRANAHYNKVVHELKAKQLPVVNYWHVLGCLPTKDPKVIQTAFRKMSLVYHPDTGGSRESFDTLVKAKDAALAQCK